MMQMAENELDLEIMNETMRDKMDKQTATTTGSLLVLCMLMKRPAELMAAPCETAIALDCTPWQTAAASASHENDMKAQWSHEQNAPMQRKEHDHRHEFKPSWRRRKTDNDEKVTREAAIISSY